METAWSRRARAASGTLTRSELIELLSERAFVFHALHRKGELVQDFIWLSALDPNHRLDLRAPPDLTAIWTSVRDQGRGVLTIQLEANANQDGLKARTNLGGTVPEGVRSQVVRLRPLARAGRRSRGPAFVRRRRKTVRSTCTPRPSVSET